MHLDLYVSLAGLIVGFVVGLTGMGGGALMTPILVLLFNVQPLAAVSSDLVAAMVMKPVGGAVHTRRGTVQWPLVKWLAMGSVPFAFAGVFLLKHLGNSDQVESRLKLALGVALLLAAGSMVVKGFLQFLKLRREEHEIVKGRRPGVKAFVLKPIPTLLIGAGGGLVVGMTSVGSGSLIIVTLLLLYPMLSMKELVGTDLVQAIPLVTSAALAHLLFGDFKLDLTTSVLIGSIPGVYLGARLSSRAPDGVIRPALVFVLMASGLKLLNMSTTELGVVVLLVGLVGLPLWGVIDALARPGHLWRIAGVQKRSWVRAQAFGAPFGVGFGAAEANIVRVRPKQTTAAAMTYVAAFGDELSSLG
jgi:uncharacterized membrane protein YfcA